MEKDSFSFSMLNIFRSSSIHYLDLFSSLKTKRMSSVETKTKIRKRILQSTASMNDNE